MLFQAIPGTQANVLWFYMGGDKDLIGTLLRAGLIAEALTKGIMPSRREKEASLELERCFLESKQEVESHSNWTVIF